MNLKHASEPASRTAQKRSQAERVIAKFGGARRLVKALEHVGVKIAPSSVYRWTYSKKVGGTGGVIPAQTMQDIVKAARPWGVMLTNDDYFPGEL